MLTAAVLGLGLAADAFAASLCQGAAARGRTHATALTVGAAFGAAQGVMPLAGWAAGLALAGVIAAVDHWIAFAVLAGLGVNMIRAGLAYDPCAPETARAASGWALAALALATSLDAAAAGLAFDAMRLEPAGAAAVIAAVTALACAAGVYIGRAAGAALGGRAELAGGAALILIGLKILVDHRAFG